MAATEPAAKQRVTVYLNPKLGQMLRRERADTQRSVSAIVEDIVRAHYRARRKAAAAAAP